MTVLIARGKRNFEQNITSSAIASVMEIREPNQIFTLCFPFLGTDLFFHSFSLNLMVVVIVGLGVVTHFSQ